MDVYDIAFCTCNTPSFNLHTPFRLHILNKVLKFLILCVEIKAKLQQNFYLYLFPQWRGNSKAPCVHCNSNLNSRFEVVLNVHSNIHLIVVGSFRIRF